VAGPLDDLMGEMPEGPKKESLIMARRNVRRLTRLVSTLMDVSRLEAGRLKGSFRLVNLGLVTRDLAVCVLTSTCWCTLIPRRYLEVLSRRYAVE
jgi:signal transduction histidine kinase